MHPSPTMPAEIKAGFHPEFESGWRKAKLLSRAVMLLVVGATLAGLLGRGPASLWNRKGEYGRWFGDQMRKLRMQEADIRTATRPQGMIEMSDMRYAIIERDATISIVPKEKK